MKLPKPVQKWLPAVLASAILLPLGAQDATAAVAAPAVTIVLDDVKFPVPVPPINSKGTILLPFRKIAEALDVNAVWLPATKSVVAKGKDAGGQAVEVHLTLGQKSASINGVKFTLNAAPVMSHDSVLVPLAFFSQAFGANVTWDGPAKIVRVVSPQREMRLLGFYAVAAYSQLALTKDMNDVAFGWSQVDYNGEITLVDTTGDRWYWPQAAGDDTPESIVGQVNANGAGSYLAVLGKDGKGQLMKMLTDKTLRDASIERLHTLVKDNAFGGIMLDFEGLGWRDDPAMAQSALNAYVKQLVAAVKPDGIKVSLAVPPLNGEYKGYDYAALAKMADELVIMAYDYGDNKKPQPNAKVDEAISKAIATGAPKSKLLLAINLDAENETTVDDKLGLAKRYGLGGAAFWRLGIFTEAERTAIGRSATKIGG
ncbi:stalk domain-containing protein [Cohnella ginsengisoli]|uniref:Stalk domain-containing protein n=1 Tax=Cohnella ginsengisoli TaxID=425004 RepID=A0A9X4QPH0_9BACL|nr:stalk domain-containing protein [Cohnella ginsengisoli]MDG0789453.1 stalk domain-containing protein [Cohnella ginsengisoli]MDG0793893.1 stalk domain-containing protein [Cohnella ginsengisoli]